MTKHTRAAARVAVALGLGAGMVIGLPGSPSAATRIRAQHSVFGIGLLVHTIQVMLPMTKAEARGHITAGARIEIRCYGSDPIFDDRLDGVPASGITYTGTPAPWQLPGLGVLKAENDGVHLTLVTAYQSGGALDEDFPDGDEVYCKARWVDARGARLETRTNTVSGYF